MSLSTHDSSCRIFFKTFSLIVNQPPPQYFGRLQPDCSGKSFIVMTGTNFLKLVGVLGVEPRTSSLSGTRSNQLSYTPAGSTRWQVVGCRPCGALEPPGRYPVTQPFDIRLYLVEPKGLEPSTSCLQSRCSSQLSYGPLFTLFFYQPGVSPMVIEH